MIYHDQLYGDWEVPEIIEELIHTPEMLRLRRISMGVLPNYLIPFGPLPSRFQHSMGVCNLMGKVLGQRFEFHEILPMMVAALYHDAGNPPFSHLSEPFLKEVTGKNGETFLADILDGSESEKIMRQHGISTEKVISIACGQSKPISDVLNGSLDLDNVDNIARHSFSTHKNIDFDPISLAMGFRWGDSGWGIHEKLKRSVENWKQARKAVYHIIYETEHIAVASMLFRAVELVYRKDSLTEDFFRMDDDDAIDYLGYQCGRLMIHKLVRHNLVAQALLWKWHAPIVEIEGHQPDAQMEAFVRDWRNRGVLADQNTELCGLNPCSVSVYMGVGRDYRRVELPFVNEQGDIVDYDRENPPSMYRIKVFGNEEAQEKGAEIKEVTLSYIDQDRS